MFKIPANIVATHKIINQLFYTPKEHIISISHVHYYIKIILEYF